MRLTFPVLCLAATILCVQPTNVFAECENMEVVIADDGAWFEPGDGWWEAGAGWEDSDLRVLCSIAGVTALVSGFSNIYMDAVAAFCAAVTIYSWAEWVYEDYMAFAEELEAALIREKFYDEYPHLRFWLNY